MRTVVCTVLLFLHLLPFAQSPNPTSYVVHEWKYNSTWEPIERYELQYVNGTDWVSEQLKSEYTSSQTWSLRDRETFSFNPNGQKTGHLSERFISQNWIPERDSLWIYNSNGDLTERVAFIWNGTAWDTVSRYRWTYSYNGFGEWEDRTKESRDVLSQQWLLEELVVVSFNAGQEWESSIAFERNGNQWDTSKVVWNYVWDDFQTRKAYSFEELAYQGNVPGMQSKYVFLWGANENLDRYTLGFNAVTQAYDSLLWKFNRFDSEGNWLNDIEQTYTDPNFPGMWFLTGTNNYFDNSYNPNGSLSEAIQFHDSGDAIFPPFRKFNYDYTITDMENGLPEDLSVTWGPHPVGSVGNMLLQGTVPGDFTLEVFDLGGARRHRLEGFHSGYESRHTWALGLPRGLYLYKLEIAGRSMTGRLHVR